MKKNIYLFSIEKALKNNNQITFNNLINFLKEEKYNNSEYSTEYFRYWFYTHFYQGNCIYTTIKYGTKLAAEQAIKDANDNECSYLAYDSLNYYEQYMTNKRIRKISLTAISISILLLVANIIKIFIF